MTERKKMRLFVFDTSVEKKKPRTLIGFLSFKYMNRISSWTNIAIKNLELLD